MTRNRERLLFVSLGVLIALAVVFVSFSIANNVVAQSGVEGGETTVEPELQSPEESEPQIAPESENHTQQALQSWWVTGSTLRPRSGGDYYTTNVSGGGGGCIYTPADTRVFFNTTLNLPQGSTIKQLRMYYRNENATGVSRGWIAAYGFYGDEVWSLNAATAGDGEGFTESELVNYVVDYHNNSYALNWMSDGDVGYGQMELCGLQVFYEPPPFGLAFLPLVEK